MFDKKTLYNHERGFTLIELLVALSVFAILIAVPMGVYYSFIPKGDLNGDARGVQSALELARRQTIASKASTQYGVQMISDKVVIFPGITYDPANSANQIIQLDPRDEIYEISLTGGGSAVVFNRLDGSTDYDGYISLRVKSDHAIYQNLYIDSSGGTSFDAPTAVGNANLVSDSRHVDFVLGWSIQNATSVQLSFPNIPQTQTIPMAAYFNADKSSFDMDYSVTVSGVVQHFRIHTLSLDTINTTLSVFRDRNGGENNQRVILNIIDGGVTKPIATYLADAPDTVQVGAYGGTMTVQ
ncbi:MAG: type II secretion system protein [Candidatus Spechtbacteria bacterium]|nr:type II secretion system protein [Candidatus Spechtbacteria bacterium]